MFEESLRKKSEMTYLRVSDNDKSRENLNKVNTKMWALFIQYTS